MFNENDFILRHNSYAKNTSFRFPLMLCIDTSLSMRNNSMLKRLNEALTGFIAQMTKDIYASSSIELSIISFGSTVDLVIPFTEIGNVKYKDLKANGNTPLTEAANLALKEIDKRVDLYESTGVPFFTPMLIIFSDGEANDSTYLSAAMEIKRRQKANTLKFKAVTLGDEKTSLNDFTLDGSVEELGDLKDFSFFDQISKSFSELSRSRPDVSNLEYEQKHGVDEWI